MHHSLPTRTALVLLALIAALCFATTAYARSTTNRAAPASAAAFGADGATCDDSFITRRDDAFRQAQAKPAASGEAYLREAYRLMLICAADQFAVDTIWVTGTKPAGTPLPEFGHLAGAASATSSKAKAGGQGKRARTLSCSATANNPVFFTTDTRYVYAGGSISCNDQVPLRGWVDLWRRYAATGTVVIPYNDIYGSVTAYGFTQNTPSLACSSNSSYKSADVLMQRYNGSSWGGNTVLDTFWHAGSNYACP